MGTSITHTKSATWMVAPPDPDADIGEVVAGDLAAIGEGRGPALVRELVDRTVEAARRALATGTDVAAALVAAVLDAAGAAAAAPPDPPGAAMAPRLRSHVEHGAAASAAPQVASGWIPRIVGSVEGVVEQCGADAERVAILVATMALIDVGGGLDSRFDCTVNGPALVAAVTAAGATTSPEALATMRALVDANAAFDRGVELGAAGDTVAALDALGRARSHFLDAGLSVEAAVTLVEQAHLESEVHDDPARALEHYGDARAVLVELDRDVEVARSDRDLALAVADARGAAAAAALVDRAAEVCERYGLGEDVVLCDVTLACLAQGGALPHTTAHYLGRAVDRLTALGHRERAARVRALAGRSPSGRGHANRADPGHPH